MIGPGSALASQICELGVHAKPVRIVAFNKTQEANWSVPWHQDRVIAIRQKAQIDGYSNWVAKSNFWHCEPPLSLLEKMVFVRIHIDDSTEETGLLELALGSHKFGKIPSHRAHALASDCDIELCEARPGDVLIVHALTLHRSSSAITPSTRRAVRADYACRSMLARELQWAI
ncbi:MAG: phytanoyl-CoA dioxygenase family protein [Pseudomonadota bacterium]